MLVSCRSASCGACPICVFAHAASPPFSSPNPIPPAQTRRLVDSPVVPLLLGIPYAMLLWQAWQAGALSAIADAVRASSPLPDAGSLAGIFARPPLAAMAWLHLLMLDLLQAR